MGCYDEKVKGIPIFACHAIEWNYPHFAKTYLRDISQVVKQQLHIHISIASLRIDNNKHPAIVFNTFKTTTIASTMHMNKSNAKRIDVNTIESPLQLVA